MKKIMHCALLGLLLFTLPAWATVQQNHADISKIIESFVRSQTLTMPGKVDIVVSEIDRRIRLSACPEPEAFLPPGGKLTGNCTVGVRCTGDKKWTLFVPVHVKISTTLLISNKPLLKGQIIRAEDITLQSGELSHEAMLTDPVEAIGKVLKFSIGTGQFLKRDMLRAPYAITEGQKVQLMAKGEGYTIGATGQALNSGAEGENIKVRTYSGHVINGMARAEGVVEAYP